MKTIHYPSFPHRSRASQTTSTTTRCAKTLKMLRTKTRLHSTAIFWTTNNKSNPIILFPFPLSQMCNTGESNKPCNSKTRGISQLSVLCQRASQMNPFQLTIPTLSRWSDNQASTHTRLSQYKSKPKFLSWSAINPNNTMHRTHQQLIRWRSSSILLWGSREKHQP